MVTLSVLEGYLQKREINTLQNMIIQDLNAISDGRRSVKEEIQRNISEYLKRDLRFRLGLVVNIIVKTADDRILYPTQSTKVVSEENTSSALTGDSVRRREVASENFKILSDGLMLTVKAQIRHNSWISNSILVFYILVALMVIRFSVRKRIKAAEEEEKDRKRFVQRLADQLDQAEESLKAAKTKEADYLERIDALRKDKDGLTTDIDALLEEIEKQETGLGEQKHLREELENQIVQLRTEIDRTSGKPKKKRKTSESARKRFAVLYKNVAFTDRALDGFIDLTDEFQLKAEQVIRNLNDDESAVPVKRKVFGKGGKMNVLEVAFSYSGRIYYQKDSQAIKTIVAVGTKNTQEKDLAYLESIAS
jgi:septal ring factor EnvC (AmiA/AmiB activator)